MGFGRVVRTVINCATLTYVAYVAYRVSGEAGLDDPWWRFTFLWNALNCFENFVCTAPAGRLLRDHEVDVAYMIHVP